MPIHATKAHVLRRCAVDNGHFRRHCTKIGAGHRQVRGESEGRVGDPGNPAPGQKRDQREQFHHLVGNVARVLQTLTDRGARPAQIGGDRTGIEADMGDRHHIATGVLEIRALAHREHQRHGTVRGPGTVEARSELAGKAGH